MPIIPSYYEKYNYKGLYGISLPTLTNVAASEISDKIAEFNYNHVIVAWSNRDMFIATANYMPHLTTRCLGDTYTIWFSGGYLTIPQFKYTQVVDYRNADGTLTNLSTLVTQICSPIQMVFNSLDVVTSQTFPTDDEYYLTSHTTGTVLYRYFHRFTLANLTSVYVWDGVDFKSFPVRNNSLIDLNDLQK